MFRQQVVGRRVPNLWNVGGAHEEQNPGARQSAARNRGEPPRARERLRGCVLAEPRDQERIANLGAAAHDEGPSVR